MCRIVKDINAVINLGQRFSILAPQVELALREEVLVERLKHLRLVLFWNSILESSMYTSSEVFTLDLMQGGRWGHRTQTIILFVSGQAKVIATIDRVMTLFNLSKSLFLGGDHVH